MASELRDRVALYHALAQGWQRPGTSAAADSDTPVTWQQCLVTGRYSVEVGYRHGKLTYSNINRLNYADR